MRTVLLLLIPTVALNSFPLFAEEADPKGENSKAEATHSTAEAGAESPNTGQEEGHGEDGEGHGMWQDYFTPEQASQWSLKIAESAVVLLAFWLLAMITRKLVRKAGVKADVDNSVINLLARSVHVALILFGLATALGTFGINVSAIVAGFGLTGFAVGFAVKDAISNLLAGVLILIHRPFSAGDSIKVKSFEGQVRSIDLRYTTLEKEDDKILVPNSILFTDPITIHAQTDVKQSSGNPDQEF